MPTAYHKKIDIVFADVDHMELDHNECKVKTIYTNGTLKTFPSNKT